MSSDLASNWNRLRDIDLGNDDGDGMKLKFGGRYTMHNLGIAFANNNSAYFSAAQFLHSYTRPVRPSAGLAIKLIIPYGLYMCIILCV